VPFRLFAISGEAPEGVKPPEGLGDPKYADLELAPGLKLAIALDGAEGSARIWVDTNLDRDLAGESPRPFVAIDGGSRATDTVALPVPGEAEPLPVEIAFRRSDSIGSGRIGVVPRLHRRGTVTLAGRVRPVALIDRNCDFRFDDPSTDQFLIDLDGDGRLSTEEGSPERMPIGQAFHLGGGGYAAAVPDATGAIVELREVTPVPPPAPPFFDRLVAPPVRDPDPPPQEKLDAVRSRLGTASQGVRIEALQQIASFGTKEAFDALDAVASKEADATVRLWAIHRMGYRCYLPFAKRLEKFTKPEQHDGVRVQAVIALHNMGAPGRGRVYAGMLESIRSAKQQSVLDALAEYTGYVATAESRKALLRAYKELAVYDLRRSLYARATHADPEGRRGLVEEALGDSESWLRGEALDDLWRLGDPKARKHALDFLAAPKPYANTDRAAVRVLAADADAEGVRAIVGIYERAEGAVRDLIFERLAPVRDAGAIKSIAAALRSDGAATRGLCADLLAGVVEAPVADALAAALRAEKEGATLEKIAQALAAHGDPRTIPALVAVAKRDGKEGRGEVLAALARVGAGSAEVAAFFVGLLGSAQWEERVLALDVAAASKESRFVAPAISNLAHAAWQVRLAAAEALGGLRPKEAIAPLIDRLDAEETLRVRAAVAETLFRLTGEPLEDIAAAWRQWWAANGDAFAVPAEVPKRVVSSAGTVATFYGVPLRSERVCFVLDRSESMEAIDTRWKGERRTRLQAAAAELLAALARLRDDARANVIFFGTEVDPWKKSLVPLSAANRSQLAKHVQGQTPAGKTNLHDALDLALADPAVDTVLLLSDGAPSAGRYEGTDEILRAVRRKNQTRRIAIHAVSLGTDSALLRRLAAENGGSYLRR